jgi:AcrR family transcriptional regulator
MDRPADDLTARARIRDAALRLFTERGIEGATIRDIAAAAGVSSGLIRHHFGSKVALREACDRYAIDRMAELRKHLVTEAGMTDKASAAATPPVAIPLQSYLVRSMMDGSATAAALFDEMVELGEQWAMRYQVKTDDLRAYATILVAMQMGVFVLRDQVTRSLGDDITDPVGWARMNQAFLDVFANPLLTPEQAEQARAAMDRSPE